MSNIVGFIAHLKAPSLLDASPDSTNALPDRRWVRRLPSRPITRMRPLANSEAVWELSPAPGGKPSVGRCDQREAWVS